MQKNSYFFHYSYFHLGTESEILYSWFKQKIKQYPVIYFKI